MMSAKWRFAAFLAAALLVHTCDAATPTAPFFCRLNELQCPSKIKQCIQSLELCNGIKNCADGSDENASFCKSYACNDTHPSSVINLTQEPYRPVFYNRKCPSGNMCTKTFVAGVQKYFTGTPWLCSGKKDCADGSDEDPRYCRTLAKNCSLNGQGVFDEFLERVADTCPSKKYCVEKGRLCDGKKDCIDGSDEWPSFCKTFKCPNSISFRCKDFGCLYSNDQICNGIKDCGDGSDEDGAFCATYKCPKSNGKKCPNGRTCLEDSQICDGVQTCPDGSDEKASFCRNFTCPGSKYKCKDGKQCVGYVEFDARCTTVEPLCKDKSDANSAFCPTPSPPPAGPGTNCSDPENQVRCPTGFGCVYTSNLCDGRKDCPDGSDEGKFCKTYNCGSVAGSGTVLCKDSLKCTPGIFCNGWNDCKDKSDENTTFCKNFKCPAGSQKCYKFPYQCIDDMLVCDGKKECINGGDEDQTFCKSYKCPTGTQKCPNYPFQCIPESLLCDGTVQCPNGGDEDKTFCKSFKCPKDSRKCPNSLYQCVNDFSLCDGTKFCANGGDEDPTFCKTFKCPPPQKKCPNSPTYQCVYDGFCDGVKNCNDGSDENPKFCKTFKCPTDQRKCPNSTTYGCVSEFSLCDGFASCSDGSDESPAFCKTHPCPVDQLKCPNSPTYQCIYATSLCDGYPNCVDGSDEDPTFCGNFTRPATP